MQRKIFIAIPLLLVAAVIGAIVILSSLDFSRYRELVAGEVAKATGREYSIAGDLELSLSLNPTLTMSGLRLANAGWGSRSEMVSIGQVEARVALLPLFSGDIQFEHLALVDVELFLESSSEGEGNWVFAGADR